LIAIPCVQDLAGKCRLQVIWILESKDINSTWAGVVDGDSGQFELLERFGFNILDLSHGMVMALHGSVLNLYCCREMAATGALLMFSLNVVGLSLCQIDPLTDSWLISSGLPPVSVG
jgi:hypothetical protein